MQKTESKNNRSNSTDIRQKNFRKYDQLINEKCLEELENDC